MHILLLALERPKMDSLSFFLGILGNIISLLVFLSPISTFWRVVKNRSTEEFESLPYICTLLGACLWTYYGIAKPDAYLVATVNGFGIIVETIYLVLFLIFAPPKRKAETASLVGIVNVGFLIAAILVTRLALQGEGRINTIGLLCAGLNIIMYGSPLVAMRRVVTSESVEYMPFSLSFFLLLNGGIWTCYAILVPNGTGFMLGTAQLVVYGLYRNAKPSKSCLEEGCLTKPLNISAASH